jgi:hypothetical protein
MRSASAVEVASCLQNLGQALVHNHIDRMVLETLDANPNGTLNNIIVETKKECCGATGYQIWFGQTICTAKRCACLKVFVLVS